MIEWIKENRNQYVFILWTCRHGLQLNLAVDWLKSQGIKLQNMETQEKYGLTITWMISQLGVLRRSYRMAKNNALISAMKAYRHQIELETTNIYGGLAMALNEIGIPAEQITALFDKSVEYWNTAIEENRNMTDWVREVVGIDIKKVTDKGEMQA